MFNLETPPVDAQTSLCITTGGLNAGFAGPAAIGPGAFAISFNSSSGPFGAPYRTLAGAFLTTGPAFGSPGSPLKITFGAPITALSMLCFSGRPFTTVTLGSAALNFQIDTVSATTATSVPEPAALLLVACSLAAALTMHGRSRH